MSKKKKGKYDSIIEVLIKDLDAMRKKHEEMEDLESNICTLEDAIDNLTTLNDESK